MTRRTNARVAGFTFLFYIAVGLTAIVLSSRAEGGGGTAAKLASIAQHALAMRMAFVLELPSWSGNLSATFFAVGRRFSPISSCAAGWSPSHWPL